MTDDERHARRERQRLAERLHDGPLQVLLSVGLRLRMLEDELPAEHREHLAEISRQVEVARDELRQLSVELGASDERPRDGGR